MSSSTPASLPPLAWLRALRPETKLVALIILIASYMSLVNLGSAPLWHDEAATGLQARYMIATGGSSYIWDGRDLFLDHGEESTSDELYNVVLPRWPAWVSMVGMLMFGDNEFGMRIIHTLFGLLSLPLFWLILRIDFPRHERFRVFAMLLFSLNTYTILFFRLGRYVPDSIFLALLTYIGYRLYLRSNNRGWLVLMSAAACLAFFNNYFPGIAFAGALGLSHLLWHRHETSLRQWLRLGSAGLIALLIWLAYLEYIGFFSHLSGTDRAKIAWTAVQPNLIWINFRDLLGFGMIPVWIAALLGVIMASRLLGLEFLPKPFVDELRKMTSTTPDIRYFLVFVLLYAAMISLTSISAGGKNLFSETRYYGALMPFFALLCAACVEWLWQWRRNFSLALAALLLLTNIPTFPRQVNVPTKKSEPWLTLPNAMKEIHSETNNGLIEAVDYLRANANQDDLVFMSYWPDRAVLQYYLGDKVLFCCDLGYSKSFSDALEQVAPHAVAEIKDADWIVISQEANVNPDYFIPVLKTKGVGLPTHRPDPGIHSFWNIEAKGKFLPTSVYKRTENQLEFDEK